jgi:3-hydroxyanthranilate 3,4-dioxygenase
MAKLTPLDLRAWIDEHRHLLKPPVGNAMVWKDSDFQVMVIGGPNQRIDYHVDPSEELFYQLEGDIVLRVIEDGQRRDIAIRQGEMLLLPPLVPHCPVRGPRTIGLVIERQRKPGDTEALRWYCDQCGAVLHEARMRVTDLGVELKPVIEQFYADEALRTCRACGAVLPAPAPAR